MTIAERAQKYKGILAGAALFLALSAGVGIGLLMKQGREEDCLWIEQLPANELSTYPIYASSTPATPKKKPTKKTMKKLVS